jgi:uncharacterized protein (TIRG00374 family)
LNLRKSLTILFTFAISGVWLYLAFRNINFRRVWLEVTRVNPWWIALSVVAQSGVFLAMAGRSRILFGPLHSFSFFRLYKSALVSFAGNNVLPLRMGEVLRIDYLARYGELPHSSCLAVVFLERLLDLFWLLMLFFGVLPLIMSNRPSGAGLVIPAVGIVCAVGGAVLISRVPELFLRVVYRVTGLLGDKISGFVNEKVALFVNGLRALGSTRSILAVLFLTGCFWMCYIMMVQLWLFAFGLHVLPWNPPAELCADPTGGCSSYSFALLMLPWFAPLFIQIFLSFGAALPSSPGFVGTYHYFASIALMTLGIQADVAASIAIVGHAISVVPFTCIAFLLLSKDLSWLLRSANKTLATGDDTQEAPPPEEPDSAP